MESNKHAVAEDGQVGKNEDRLWRSVFAVQTALTEITTKHHNNRREQALAVLWAIIDGIQLLALVIGRTSGFDPSVTRPIVSWIDLHILFTQHTWESYTKTFWAYFIITLIVIMAFFYYLLRLSKGKGRSTQVWMSIAARGFLFGLYIPYLKLFGSVFACGQDDFAPGRAGSPGLFVCLDLNWTIYAAISGGTLAFFIIVSLLFFLFFRHNHIRCPDWESRPHGRFNAVYAAGRIAMVAAAIVVETENIIVCLVFLACTFAALYYHLEYLPSYRPMMNFLRGGFLASATFLAVASCIMTSIGRVGEPSRALGTAVSVALAGFAFACGLGAVWYRYWQANKQAAVDDVAKASFKSPTEVEIAVRVLLYRDESPEAVTKAEALYRSAMLEFPSSCYLQLQLAHFIKAYVKNAGAASAEIRVGWRKEPSIDYRYELHSTKLFWERQAQLYQQQGQVGSADLFSSADAKKQYENARQSHTRTLKLTRQFWIQLTKKNLHVVGALDDVPRRLADIHHVAMTAENAYVVLIKRYGSSKILLRSYASFLEHCLNDKARAQLYYMKADEVEESESKTASLSASQSQSQSQSAGGGAGAASQSASESASSGASSSAAAKKRAANRELKMKSNETRAVRRLFWGVVIGLLLLGGLACAMFIAVKLLFVEYTQNNNRLRFISFQRRRVVAVNNMIRWMHLGALTNNTELFTYWAGQVGIRSKDFSYDHRGLYFGYTDLGIPASTSPDIVQYWKAKDTKIVMHYPGPPVYEVKEQQSMWDAGNTIMIMCRRISLMKMDEFRDITKLREVKYVFQNALFGILDALQVGATVYEDDVMATIEKAKWVLLSICLFSCLSLICEALFVFRPSFAKVRVTMRGVSDILEGIPRPLLKQIAKHYSKAQKNDNENDGDSQDEEGKEKEKRDGSSGSDRGGSSSDDGGSEGGKKSARRRRRQSKDSEGEEKEEKKKKHQKKEKKHSKHGKKGKRKEDEEGASGSERKGSGSEGEAEQRAAAEKAAAAVEAGAGPRASVGSGASSLVRPPSADAPAPAALNSRGNSPGSGGRRSGPPSRGSERARLLAGAAAGPARAPAIVGDLEVSSSPLRGILDGLEGQGGREEGGSGGEELLAVPELQESPAGDAVHVLRPDPAKGAKPSSFTSSLERNSAGSSGGESAAEEAEGKGRSRSQSIQLSLGKAKMARRESVGVAGGGILRKVVKEEEEKAGKASDAAKKYAVEDSDDEKQKKKKHEKHEKDGKGETKEEEKKKKEKEEKKKKKAEAAAEGQQGADILTKLTRKYTVAFFIIAGIFIINFVVCFVILDAGKGFAYEINLAGRRRSIAREVAFYARELYINDDIFLPRDEIYARLVKKSNLFKTIHQALKFGNPDFNVAGANGRNKALDEIMYFATCLRISQAKCKDDRVEDMQLVVNGLDTLVIGVVDLITEIMQETAPDLLLTGKEDPVIADANDRNYYRLDSHTLKLLMEIDDGDLDDGLNQAAAAFVSEALTSMGVVEMMEALILTFVVIFLGALYIYLFGPMLARLGEETGRAGQILKMVPRDVVLKCVHLHRYFVGISGDADDE